MRQVRYSTWLSTAVLGLFVVASGNVFAQERGAANFDGAFPVDTPTAIGDPIEGDWHEGFDDITTLPDDGWAIQNNSNPVGSASWFQGNPGVFPAHQGAPDSYIGVNFNSVSGANTISNWLMTPEMVMQNGTAITFWTRTGEGSAWPDRLQVRASFEGSSTDVGSGPEDVGDFTLLLLDINESYDLGGYPEEWTPYTLVISGLDAPTSGRFAFRYYTHDGGPAGSNSNYIGIDEVEVEQPAVSSEPGATAGSFALSPVYPNPVVGVSHLDLQLDVAQHVSVEVFNLLGQRVATVFQGTAAAGNTLVSVDGSGLTAGLYVVRVVGEDFTQSRKFVVSN